jgi:endoglucanase
MKRAILLVLIFCLSAGFAKAQSVAQKRADRMGLGVNLSYLENWWVGTKDKHYSDFAKPDEAAKREKEFADIAKAGFKTVRIPICFSAWMEMKRPFNWDNPGGLEMADQFVKWALANGLNVIIDLHHPEFDGKMPEAANPERIVNLWFRIAERYKNTDPERVFFELRNEPHDMAADVWRWQAKEIIKVVRPIAPKHTLIVGFHDWNSRKAMIESATFDDPNIIYTFHYYDPFIFTHQGADWVGNGMPELRGVPFPLDRKKIDVPATVKGTWIEKNIDSYREDSNATKMFADLKAAKDWSVKNKAPIFLGEFGSFSKYSALADRCRHAAMIYSALGRLKIPNTWWEWDGGFNMFDSGTTRISECMRTAIDSFEKRLPGG